jgi:hypothetical protein
LLVGRIPEGWRFGLLVGINVRRGMSHYAKDKFEKFNVTEDEVSHFRNSHVGFCRVDMNRISQFFLIQLASISKHRIYNSFSIIDVIQELEGVGRGCKPRVNQFKHPPLKGIWKAHFFDARFLVKNIVNHFGLEDENSPKFSSLYNRVIAEEDECPTKHGWQGRLAHEMTVAAYEERSKKNRRTGEWIVFSKHNGKNYYLFISNHTSKEEDQDVHGFFKILCEHEFPFLLSENAT